MVPRGLPERLPSGEKLLWQGAPGARALLAHMFHVRAVAVYFALILAWCAAALLSHGASAHGLGTSLLHRAEVAVVPFALMALYAWSIQRTTVYSITSRRVLIRCGIAVPITFNLPFARIEAAGLRLYAGGSGDVPLRLLPGEKMSYFVIWPHARPWRMARTEPMLRCVPDADKVSVLLGAALAEHEAAQGSAESGRVVPFKPVRMTAASGLLGRVMAAE